MTWYQTEDPFAFIERIHARCVANEARVALMLGCALELARSSGRVREVGGAEAPLFAAVEDTGQVAAAAFCTPPHSVQILTFGRRRQPEALAVLMDHLAEREGVPGFFVEDGLRAEVAGLWQARGGRPTQHKERVVLMELAQEPREGDRPDGCLVPATGREIELVLEWSAQFKLEAVREPLQDGERRRLRGRIEAGDVFLWRDDGGTFRSMAYRCRRTFRGESISGVFTPPADRGRGFATALVAEVARTLFNGGRRFCTLFADVKNPTARGVYERLGFVPVGTFVNERVAAAGAGCDRAPVAAEEEVVGPVR